MTRPEPAPSAVDLRAALLPLLTEAGWTEDPRAWGLAMRGNLALSLDDGQLYLDVTDAEHCVACLLDVRVPSVAVAVAYLRNAGALPPQPEYEPALLHGGQSTAWVHGCGLLETWPTDPDYLASEGPITDQGCDACDSAPDGGWRQLYVQVTS